MKAFLIFVMVLPSILCRNIMLLDITPEEAQKYIAEQSLELSYGKKLGEGPIPLLKSADGNGFMYQGRIIENPEDYIEETYLASQFHGQDGLGRYMFGHTDNNQARLEARNANGDVRGSYKYLNGDGEEITVEYWADTLGFHQKDNIPIVPLVPVTDTPEVQAARLEHERAWKEAAIAAKAYIDPKSDIYNRLAIKGDADREEKEHALQLIAQSSENKESVADSDNKYKSGQYEDEDNEPKGPPRGFFYSFDYPVSTLISHGSAKVKRSADDSVAVETSPEVAVVQVKPEEKVAEAVVIVKPEEKATEAVAVVKEEEKVTEAVIVVKPEEKTETVAADVKPFVKTLETGVSLKANSEGLIPIDGVHDQQVHPNQKADLVNSQVLPVLIHE